MGATVNGHLFVTPNQFGPAQVDGIISDYPAQEGHHESAFGPIADLPDHHPVVDLDSIYWKCYDRVTGAVYVHRPYPKTTLTEGGSPPSVDVVPGTTTRLTLTQAGR